MKFYSHKGVDTDEYHKVKCLIKINNYYSIYLLHMRNNL